ncbi:MAG: hypothetical protein ABW224_03535 [Kibdelosporangium sp.]
MAEAVLRNGIDPEDLDRVILAVVIDPDGSPGERAVMALADSSFPDEEANVAHILQTDAFTECELNAGELTVDFMVFPSPARADGQIDDADFPERSAREPLAIKILRVTGRTTHDQLPDEVLVYTTPLDRLTEEDCPLLFAPPPEN